MTELSDVPSPSDPVTELRVQWEASIGGLTDPEAKAALLQAMIDIDEHRQLDHSGDGAEMSGAIADHAYLANVVGRIEQRRKETHEQDASDVGVWGYLLVFGMLISVLLVPVGVVASIVVVTGGFTPGLVIPLAVVGGAVFGTILWFRFRGRRP